jgi:hypothetical protein
VATELEAVSVDFHRYLDFSAVSVSTNVFAPALEMAGAFFDYESMMLRITPKGFSTLLHYFCTVASDSPAAGDKFPNKPFQQLGSLAIYSAIFFYRLVSR